jgi:hypothetical protein
MTLDEFGREIKANINELKAALEKSTLQTKASTEKTDEGTQQLIKLNQQLKALIGDDLNKEITSLNKLLVKVKDNYAEQNEVMKKSEQATKGLNKELEDYGDNVTSFGERLGRGLRQLVGGFDELGTSLKAAVLKRTDVKRGIVDAFSVFGNTLKGIFRKGAAATQVADTIAAEKATQIPDTVAAEKPLFSIEKELQELPNVDNLQDLCECICKCLGVNFKKVQTIEQGTNNAITKQGAKEGGWFKNLISKISLRKEKIPMDPGQEKLMNEMLREQRLAKKAQVKEFNQQRADRFRQAGVQRGAGLGRAIFEERPAQKVVEAFWPKFAQAGGAILSFTGDLLESIPFVGGALKAVGHALGGFAEGLINSVLNPIISQVDAFSDAMEAMFISRGATNLAPVVNMGEATAPSGEEWSIITKRSAEFGQNIDAASRALETFSVQMSDVAETGQSFSMIQKTIATNFKRGIRDAKELKNISKASLQTATLIGANAEHTAELFADWHQKLGMSGSDLRIMQTNLRDVARSTGLFGDALVQVAKQSEQFMQNMRVAGNLTTTAARQITELTARGRLTGTEAATSRLLQTLSTGILRGGGGPKEQAFAAIGGGANIGLQQKALYGTLLDSEDAVREFAENLEAWGARLAKARPGESFAKALERMTPEQRARLTAVLENSIGVGAEEFRIVIDNLAKTGASFNQRLAEINKQVVNENAQRMSLDKIREVLGDKESAYRKRFDEALKESGDDAGKAIEEVLKMVNLPREIAKQLEGQIGLQQAQFQRQELLLSTGSRLIDEFNKNIAKEGTGFQDAIAPLTNKQSYQEYITAIGGNFKDGGDALEKALMDQAKILQERSKDLGISVENMPTGEEIKKAIVAAQGGDRGKDLKNIATQFQRIQGAIALQAKRRADPILDISITLKEIQGAILSFIQSKVFQGLQLLGSFIEDLKKQPFWEAFSKGDLQKGFSLLGDWVKNLPKYIAEVFAQLKTISSTPEFQLFITGLLKGFLEFNDKLFEWLGESLKEAAPKLSKFILDLKKTFEETDWGEVGENIGILFATITAPETIASITALVVSIKGLAEAGEGALKFFKELSPTLKIFKDYVVLNNKEGKLAFEENLANARLANQGIGGVWEELMNMIVQNTRAGFALIRGDFDGLWDAIKSGITSAIRVLQKVIIGMVELVVTAMEKLHLPGSAGAREELDTIKLGMKIQDTIIAAEVQARKKLNTINDAFLKTTSRNLKLAGKTNEEVQQTIVNMGDWSKENFGKIAEAADIPTLETEYEKLNKEIQNNITKAYAQWALTEDEKVKKEKLEYIESEKIYRARLDILKKTRETMLLEQAAIEQNKSAAKDFLDANKIAYKAAQDFNYEARKAAFTPEQAKAEEAAKARFQQLGGGETYRQAKIDQIVKELGALKPQEFAAKAQSSEIAKRVMEEKTPQERKILAGSFIKTLEEGIDIDKMTYEEYVKTLEQISLLKKLQEQFTKEALKKGSIFVQDVDLLKSVDYGVEMLGDIYDGMDDLTEMFSDFKNSMDDVTTMFSEINDNINTLQEANVTATAKLPTSAIEEQLKRQYAEMDPEAEEMSQIESNTRDTAASNRQIVGALRAIGRMLANRRKSSDLNLPEMQDTVFWDEIVNTEWPGARQGRIVGLELDYTDLA